MSNFDHQVKKEIQSFLNSNVRINENDLQNIQNRIRHKKRFNPIYLTAFIFVSVISSILILPFIHDGEIKDITPVPYSKKGSEQKESPSEPEQVVEQEEDDSPDESSDINNVNQELTEDEKEAIFLEQLEKYNKLPDINFEYNRNDTAKADNSLGYKITNYSSKDVFLAQFSDFVTPEVASKMFWMLFENENGLYLIVTEHLILDFLKNEPYKLTKITDDKYQITQTYTDDIFKNNLFFEFSKVDENWIITDWKSSIEGKERTIEEIFIDLAIKYNQSIHENYIDPNDLREFEDGTGGYKIVDYGTKNNFYLHFSHIMTEEAFEKIWGPILVENNDGLFLIPTEPPFFEFLLDNPYSVTQLNEEKYRIEQSNVTTSGIESNIMFEISNLGGKWLISDFHTYE